MAIERSAAWIRLLTKEQLAHVRSIDTVVDADRDLLIILEDLPDDFPPEAERGGRRVSFMAQHYHCCPGGSGDATLTNQNTIINLLGAIATQIGDADTVSDAKQDLILDEIGKLTGGLTTG